MCLLYKYNFFVYIWLYKSISKVEEVSMHILKDQGSLNRHFKAGIFNYIKMEIPL